MGRNWDILTNEWANDPEGRGYSGMSPQQVANEGNTKLYRTSFERTLIGLIRALDEDGHDGEAIGRRLVEAVEAARASDQLIAEFQQMLRNASALDWAHPRVLGVLATFRDNTSLSFDASDYDAIDGLSANKRSRAEVLGTPPWQAAWVETYRG